MEPEDLSAKCNTEFPFALFCFQLTYNIVHMPTGASEILLSKCDAVKVVPYSNPVIYELGKIVLTNFKISFLRSESIDGTTVSETFKSIIFTYLTLLILFLLVSSVALFNIRFLYSCIAF